jgi:hypothetical protein
MPRRANFLRRRANSLRCQYFCDAAVSVAGTEDGTYRTLADPLRTEQSSPNGGITAGVGAVLQSHQMPTLTTGVDDSVDQFVPRSLESDPLSTTTFTRSKGNRDQGGPLSRG